MAPHWFRGYVSSVFSLRELFGFSLSGSDIPEYFQELCSILTCLQTRNENTKQYYTPNTLITYLLSNFFFSPAKSFCSFLIRREK